MGFSRTLLALIVGQLAVHGCMAGVRVAAPLQALHDGHAAWAVGLLMALFAAAPVFVVLRAGRLADRHGYHLPMHLGVALTMLGALTAVASTWAGGFGFALLCVGATLVGAGANIGLITIQRTAGRSARDATERVKVFSWLGLAPSLANVVGSVTAGLMIDLGGFRAAFAVLALLPLIGLWSARRVPRETPGDKADDDAQRTAWELLRTPGMRRLLFVNWLLSASWDVHSFALPILGHERGFSASTIGLILGVFPLAVSGVRLIVPLLAHRAEETQVLRWAMLGTGAVFAVYPLVHSPWLMGLCAISLGVPLGCVQPMVMSRLHHLTPHERHGEAIALRSMTLNLSSTMMPLLFGAAGTALGVGPLFWLMGAAVGSGSWATRRLAPSSRTV
jgi:MFS family permease